MTSMSYVNEITGAIERMQLLNQSCTGMSAMETVYYKLKIFVSLYKLKNRPDEIEFTLKTVLAIHSKNFLVESLSYNVS